jgi:uncharacterized membrane protein
VPPLSSTGLFLSIQQWDNAYGAFLLFLTNLTAIALTSGIIFTLVGFRPSSIGDKDPGKLVALLVLLVFTNLTVRSIDASLEKSYQDKIQNIIRIHLTNDFERKVRLLNLDIIDEGNDLLDVIIRTTSTEEFTMEEIQNLTDALAAHSKSPIQVSIINMPMISALSSAGTE